MERSLSYLSEISVSELKGFGEKRINSLKKHGINSVTDLIRIFPRKHYDRSKIMNLSEVPPNIEKEITIFGKITDISVFTTKTRLRITTLTINDETGIARAKWFGPQYIESRFKKDDIVAVAGVPDVKKTGTVEFKNPVIESFSSEQDLSETGSFISFYPKIDGVPNKVLRSGIKQALERIPELKDIIPDKDRNKFSLYTRLDSYQKIHFPESFEEYKLAKKRLAFDEFIYLQSLFSHSKDIYKTEQKSYSMKIDASLLKSFDSKIPFSLTNSQKSCIKEIFEDLSSNYPMKRLLQGDVGSGKTIVAAAGVYAAIENGKQVALMAPTEVLAEQHLNSFEKYLNFFDIDMHILTSSVKDRKSVMKVIENGDPALIIGTHALIQENVKFNNLGLAIIDEQQRFGVEQRKKLMISDDLTPHQLVMTATPIPRTTALAIYGDLELSIINEMPPGRKKINSKVLAGGKRESNEVFNIAREHLEKKSQIFVVCPYIEESENSDIKAAEKVYELYKSEFNKYNVELLHGKMKADEKENKMLKMKNGEIDIMVSTVVIEVGIDITNATLMIIESAERFGLNQLHQLRGRVGRGDKQSECIFHITEGKSFSKITKDGQERLNAIEQNDDGFKLSELDLQIRGEGKVTGTSQSGLSDLKIANLRTDYEILETSKEYFTTMEDEELKSELFLEANLLFPNFGKTKDST